jgi:hypothetical protein
MAPAAPPPAPPPAITRNPFQSTQPAASATSTNARMGRFGMRAGI